MTISQHIKIIVLATCMGSLSFLYAEVPKNPFGVESGLVMYDISSETQLTPETNLTIRGKGRLRFKEWGDVRIEEEDNVVLTTGAIKHKQEVKKFTKFTKDTIVTVDYENEQLLERKKSPNNDNENQTRFLVKSGQEEVAGVLCDMWEGTGIKKCIHKGIVLKSESKVLGVTYLKVANSITFDINISSQECKTPDYPVHEFALIQDKIKTKNALKPQKFSVVLKDVVYDINENNTTYGDNNITDEERIKFINYLGKNIYTRQKELLPVLLDSIKKTRECLQTGEDPFSANECIENFSRMKSQLGTQEDDYIILWDNEIKNILLDKIEDELLYLESRMPCVSRAKNINDLSTCMK
jgi:hypothetical protein